MENAIHDKHLCLIHAGGTIGMAPGAHGLAPWPQFPQRLQQLLDVHAAELPRVTVVCDLPPIDSSNAVPADWQALAQHIAARYPSYDGFVVLHGTDTMAYTASALSFMLQGLRKPVILSGAQLPLIAAGSDAARNVIGALQLAAADELREVAICFNQRLLRGNRAVKFDTSGFDAFISPAYPVLAEIGTALEWNRAALLPAAAAERFAFPTYRAGQVVSWRAAPGMPLRTLELLLADSPPALILEAYGSGNLPDRDPALLALLARASSAGTVLVARSQCLRGRTQTGIYAAGSALAAAGVIGAGTMTFEAAYAKLHHLLALGLAPDQLRAAFGRDLAGEC